MVFSAALNATTTTGVAQKANPVAAKEYPALDLQPELDIAHTVNEKHDALAYTVANASFIGLAGLVAGLQEAFYTFEATLLLRIVGRKTLLGTAIGAAFCYTEATVENLRGVHDGWNGAAGGLAAGLVFGLLPPKPLPQPIAWPLTFAVAALAADVVGEHIPATLTGFKHWGALPHRPGWGDPEPPRPPILDTGAGARPWMGNFWRGA